MLATVKIKCLLNLKKNKIVQLKEGDYIRLNTTGEIFKIDKVFSGNIVDMTTTKPYNEELMPGYFEKFFSVHIANYEIVRSVECPSIGTR